MIETYKGRRLKVTPHRASGRSLTQINDQVLVYSYGITDDHLDKQMTNLRACVDAADERRKTEPHAYAAYMYEGAPE